MKINLAAITLLGSIASSAALPKKIIGHENALINEIVAKREAAPEADAEAWMRGHPRANWGLTGPQKREAAPEADAEAWMRGHPRANWGLTGPQKREAAPEADADAEAWMRGHPRANWGLTGP